MRVTGPSAPQVGASQTVPNKDVDAARLFDLTLGGPGAMGLAAKGQLTGLGALSGLDTILALQEVARDIGSRKRSIRRGHDLLDKLDDIKAGLLSGRIDTNSLDRIVDLLRQRESSGDDRIDGLMDEIDLRAQVELAKLGRFSD